MSWVWGRTGSTYAYNRMSRKVRGLQRVLFPCLKAEVRTAYVRPVGRIRVHSVMEARPRMHDGAETVGDKQEGGWPCTA